MERYQRNIETLSIEENNILWEKRVAVIGCGGLGGYCLEMLGRIGVGHITAVDGDIFVESNLNRQILSNTDTIGKSKAIIAEERMAQVNPKVTIKPVDLWLSKDNALCLLTGHDVVVDAMDNIPSRLLLAEACWELKIPLVHGAIAGWYGQVATIMPGERTMEKIYRQESKSGIETRLGNPSFTPALVAAMQVAEVIKLLIGRGEHLSGGEIMFIDTLHQEYTKIML